MVRSRDPVTSICSIRGSHLGIASKQPFEIALSRGASQIESRAKSPGGSADT